jgi:hypothetical protein
MTFRIPRGRHRARPLRFGIWFNRNSFTWTVKFTESCRYDLHSANQGDTNKLIGIGYLPGHHKDSARFGWRYDTKTEQVEILAYCYVNGRREIRHICYCMIRQQYDLHLKVLSTSYYLAVHYKADPYPIGCAGVDHRHNKKFVYRLGTFFGGNQKAPHEMTIEIKKV